MITLLHGENISASRARFQQLQAEIDADVVTIDLKDQIGPDPLAALQTTGLFSDRQFAAIENAVTSKELEKIAKYDLTDAVFWEGKKLTSTQITTFQKVFPKASILEFKIDPVVFKFVESIRPNNVAEVINLFRKYQKTDPSEVIFTMIVRQFRHILLASTNESNGPDEWLRASWQKTKLASQAKSFPSLLLREKYHQLGNLDYYHKTGQLPHGSLEKALELFLLTL